MIRLEKKDEYREVENLVRESFWNVYRPGCYEHYVILVLRDDPAFVKPLDIVMEQAGQLIGGTVEFRSQKEQYSFFYKSSKYESEHLISRK